MNEGLRLALSFLVGGIWVAATTAVAERRGSRQGGFIGGMPSTLAVALVFVAWTGGVEAARTAAEVAPLAFAVNGLFVLVFAIGSRHGFHLGMGVALATWGVLQTAIVWAGGAPLGFSVAAWVVVFAVCWILFRTVLALAPQPATGPAAGPLALVLRALASGALVAAAVGISQRGGAVAGGVLASAPVVFVSSLFIANRTMGLEFARAMGRSLLFSAVINCSVFALAFHVTVSRLPLLPAFALAYAVTIVAAIPVYRLRLG